MKSRGNFIHSTMLRSQIFQTVSAGKKRKRVFMLKYYGTSSKQATSNLNSTKIGVLSNLKVITDSIIPTLLKSATVVSSLFNSVQLSLSKFKRTTDNSDNTKAVVSLKSINPEQTKIEVKNQVLSSTTDSSIVDQTKKDIVRGNSSERLEANRDMEQNFFDWLTGGELRKEFLNKDEKQVEQIKKTRISKISLQERSRFLVTSLCDATSAASQLLRLEEVCKHLILYPDQKSVMCKAGLVRIALRLRYNQYDAAVQSQARCVLALVGYHNPPRGSGIRILSIDGGGTRGMLAIEVLRQLEAKTNKKVYQLFDFFCGVSSGAILGLLLGGLRLSLDECESLYRTLSDKVFSQSTFWGTSRLMWSHAYYDTTLWVKTLQ